MKVSLEMFGPATAGLVAGDLGRPVFHQLLQGEAVLDGERHAALLLLLTRPVSHGTKEGSLHAGNGPPGDGSRWSPPAPHTAHRKPSPCCR